jgi:diguanylate cyclase (GGDEF)-like protein/PAS domain S-box-containing protein
VKVRAFAPSSTGQRAIVAILLTFALSSAVSITLSIWATSRAQHHAAVIQVAARQRTLAERYVKEVMLVRDGRRADPRYTGGLLAQSADVLLNGGTAPAINGDDDETWVPRIEDPSIRRQLEQERRLVNDLTATGNRLLEGRSVTGIRLTADERIDLTDPVERLRIISTLTSNVSLNAARAIGATSDRNLGQLITIQALLGTAGLLVTLLLALALIAATRRRTAHFRSIVSSSTDLVLVLGPDGCRYVSPSVVRMVGLGHAAMAGEGFMKFVHTDDRATIVSAQSSGGPTELVFRMRNRFEEWRHLEAHVSDLRGDRHIRGVVMNARDVTDRIRLEEELTHQAYHDGLTGLPNRALFRDRLGHALALSQRSAEGIAVALIDLDGFKQVNDSLGHDAGDELLRQVASQFGAVTRPSDTLARFGGDEFALLLEGCSEHEAIATVRRLLTALAHPILLHSRELALGASVGLALYGAGTESSEELIRHADVAMYAAKEAGRGRIEVFRVDMERRLGETLGLEYEIRVGLERDEFFVHYQPEIDIRTGAVVGVEALLRWESPNRGSVPPSTFIPVAEANGLIMPLGAFVLGAAVNQTATWQREGLLPDGFVTWVNLSGRQLTRGISEVVEECLASAGLNPSMLGLEVTETAIVQTGAAGELARDELQRLHARGVLIAIDDFGTGFSSLGQLREFPVDLIKVDRSFVQGSGRDAKDAAITANVVSLAHALGLLAIAEGIESEDQLSAMKELGCDLAQGYLFARPLPPEEVRRGLVGGDWSQLRAA